MMANAYYKLLTDFVRKQEKQQQGTQQQQVTQQQQQGTQQKAKTDEGKKPANTK